MKPAFMLLACAAAVLSANACTQETATTSPAPKTTSDEISFVATGDPWVDRAQETLQANLKKQANKGPAKNVILFIGDGMDPTTVTAGRIYEGQNKGLAGEDNVLAMETLPHLALSKTYSSNSQTPDSAATASAMMTGVKTRNGVINVKDSVPVLDCAASIGNTAASIGEYAEQIGMATGVVSTARLTHATPSTVYAHSASRNWETDGELPKDATECKDIARQFVDFAYGDGIDVALGGGRGSFLSKDDQDPEYTNRTGRRTDGQNLVTQWQDKYPEGTFVWNKEQFDAIPADTKRLLGLFDISHMQYSLDRSSDMAGEPSLAEMTAKSIDILSQNDQGYFLMVEGGRIDHAHHGGNAARALADLQAFDEAIETALSKVDLSDTLVIVTADHGHTLTISGYAQRGNPILGVVISPKKDGSPSDTPYPAADGKPYTTLSYANGPGSVMAGPSDTVKERPFVTMEEALDPDYKQQSLVPSRSETHGGQDVIIFAGGPDAYLFDGIVEQNYIFHVIDHALSLKKRAQE